MLLEPGEQVRIKFSRVITNGVAGQVVIPIREINNGVVEPASVTRCSS